MHMLRGLKPFSPIDYTASEGGDGLGDDGVNALPRRLNGQSQRMGLIEDAKSHVSIGKEIRKFFFIGLVGSKYSKQ